MPKSKNRRKAKSKNTAESIRQRKARREAISLPLPTAHATGNVWTPEVRYAPQVVVLAPTLFGLVGAGWLDSLKITGERRLR